MMRRTMVAFVMMITAVEMAVVMTIIMMTIILMMLLLLVIMTDTLQRKAKGKSAPAITWEYAEISAESPGRGARQSSRLVDWKVLDVMRPSLAA